MMERETPDPALDADGHAGSNLRRAPWLLLMVWGLVLGLDVVQEMTRPAGAESLTAVLVQSSGWLGIALAALPILLTTRRNPAVRPSWGHHLMAGSGLTLAYGACFAAAVRAFVPGRAEMPVGDLYLRAWLAGAPLALMAYGVLAGTVGAARAMDERQRALLSQARVSALLSEARLESLRARLHPHFLFNALNAVGVLVRGGEQTSASRALDQLSSLLRSILRHDVRQEVSLDEELHRVSSLLDLQRLRFGPRLEVEVEVTGEARSVAVPAFILFPLVENAVKHGLAARGGGRIRILGRMDRGVLRLAVEDDGPGLVADPPAGEGLDQARDRLRILYGEAGTLSLESREGEPGSRAVVTIPVGSGA